MSLVSLPKSVNEFLQRKQTMYIGGERVHAASGQTFEVRNPANGDLIANVPSAGAEDIDRAVRAARAAFTSGPWVEMGPAKRARLLWRLADLIEENAESFATLDTLDNGKPIGLTRTADVPLTVELFRYMAGWATKIEGATKSVQPSYEPDSKFFTYTVRQPVGVCAQIVPWNYPLMMAAYKLAPALASGCTVVLKPAEQTPLSALLLADLFEEAGFPDGVYNVVTGYGETAGAALAQHPDIDKIAFTGSTEVGREIFRGAADSLKHVSLELGGKSPNIIFEDADLARAITKSCDAIFFNQGQACCAGSRLYVERSIFKEVLEGVKTHAEQIRLGNGLDESSEMGPLVDKGQVDRVAHYVDIAVQDGASIVTGGAPTGDGRFYKPTVITDLDAKSRSVQEEIFGPVVIVTPFDSEQQAVDMANDSQYGLASAIWTKDISRAHRIAAKINAGTVWINTYHIYDAAMPLGGFKQSGIGREKGEEVLSLYTETKTVCVELS